MSLFDKAAAFVVGISIFMVGLATVISFIVEVIVTAVEHWKEKP